MATDNAHASQKALTHRNVPRARDFTNQRTRRADGEVQRSKTRNKSKFRARIEHVFVVSSHAVTCTHGPESPSRPSLDNGGETIRRRHEDPDLASVPVQTLLPDLMEDDGGPLIWPPITASEQNSFDSTCGELFSFLNQLRDAYRNPNPPTDSADDP